MQKAEYIIKISDEWVLYVYTWRSSRSDWFQNHQQLIEKVNARTLKLLFGFFSLLMRPGTNLRRNNSLHDDLRLVQVFLRGQNSFYTWKSNGCFFWHVHGVGLADNAEKRWAITEECHASLLDKLDTKMKSESTLSSRYYTSWFIIISTSKIARSTSRIAPTSASLAGLNP